MHSIASVKATRVAPSSQSLTTVKPMRLTELHKEYRSCYKVSGGRGGGYREGAPRAIFEGRGAGGDTCGHAVYSLDTIFFKTNASLD